MDQRAVKLLAALIHDFGVRSGSDKSGDVFRRIDDKWLFTRSFFEGCAKEAGLRELEIYPLHAVSSPFSQQTQTNLRLGAGLDASALPDWAWDVLRHYDNVFSDELKRDLLIEGGIIFRK